MSRRDFQVFAPLTFFQKASAPAGKQKRIAGIISTELKDKQDETILQRGLDFSPFLKSGWFNDNHSKATTAVLGYPDFVKPFQKGDVLPDGQRADCNGTWSEGWLLDTPEAAKVWDLGLALQKAGGARRLGFSIEGQVLQRQGPQGKIVAKALVRNVAVTNCPVGEATRLEVLAKSLRHAEDAPEDWEKGLTAGTATPGTDVAAEGDLTGEGAGRVLAPQHLEGGVQTNLGDGDNDEDDKELDEDEVVKAIRQRTGCDHSTAERAMRLFQTLKLRGQL